MGDIVLFGELIQGSVGPLLNSKYLKGKPVLWTDAKSQSDVMAEVALEDDDYAVVSLVQSWVNSPGQVISANWNLSNILLTGGNSASLSVANGVNVSNGTDAELWTQQLTFGSGGSIAPNGSGLGGYLDGGWVHTGTTPAITGAVADSTGLKLHVVNGSLTLGGSATVGVTIAAGHTLNVDMTLAGGGHIAGAFFGGTGTLNVTCAPHQYGSVVQGAVTGGLTVTYTVDGELVPSPGSVDASTTAQLGALRWDPKRGLAYSNTSNFKSIIDIPLGPHPTAETFPYVVKTCSPTGNDTTGDGSVGKPYLTPERAAQDYPFRPNGTPFRVDMTNYGTYAPTAPFPMPPMFGGGMSYFARGGHDDPNGDGAAFGYYQMADFEIYAKPTVLMTITGGAPGSSSYSIAGDGTQPNHSILTVTGASWTADQFKDMLFQFVGAGADYIGTVITNTANTLTVVTPYDFASYFGTTVDGYTYNYPDVVLSQPSCSIDLGGSYHDSYYGWLQTDSYRTAFQGNVTVAGITFLGVQTNNNSGNVVDYGFRCNNIYYIGCQNLGLAGAASRFVNVFGCSIYEECSANTNGDFTVQGSTFGGLYAFSNEGNGRLIVYACYGDDKNNTIGYGDSIGEGFYHGPPSAYTERQTFVQYTTKKNTARGGARAVGPNNYLVVGKCNFAGCGYGGIRMEWGAKLFIVAGVSGTGNGAGIYLLDDSKMFVAPYSSSIPVIDATNLTVTGTNGDLVVGELATIPWTVFFAWKSFRCPLTQAQATQRGMAYPHPEIVPREAFNGPTNVGLICKVSTIGADAVEPLRQVTNGDQLKQACGVAFQTIANGTIGNVFERRGQDVLYQLDSAASVTFGQPLYLSATDDGMVSGAATSGIIVSYARESAVASALVRGPW